MHVTEADATANVARDDAGEHVEAEVNASEAPEGADAGRDLSLQAVGAQVEQEQESEVTDSRGDGAGEPLGAEVQSHHPPPVPPAAGDALPAAGVLWFHESRMPEWREILALKSRRAPSSPLWLGEEAVAVALAQLVAMAESSKSSWTNIIARLVGVEGS